MVSLEQSDATLVVSRDERIAKILRTITIFSKQSPIGAVAGVFLVIVAVMAAAAPIVAPFHPLEADFAVMTYPPDSSHLLGTDPLGRDTLSRIIYGARYTLLVAFAAVLLGTTFGAVLGVASAYLGGKFDLGVQRVLEVLQAFPDLILALLLMVALGPGLGTVIVAIAVTRIPFGGRVVRSVALQIREMDYVTAARAVGVSSFRIMRLHVAPQCVAPYLVLATAHLGVAIIIEASLGFLGVGIPPPTPTWGNMLAMQGNNLIPPWWLVVYPGVAITLIVLAFSLFGDGLRDYLDPRLRGRL